MYRLEELTNKSDDELLSILKKEWGYGISDEFEIYGHLSSLEISTDSKVGDRREKKITLYFLENFWRDKFAGVLNYPINGKDTKHTVYVDASDAQAILKENNVTKPLVRANVEFSPKLEREKRDNPFALKTSSGSPRLLTEIPENLKLSIVDIGNDQFVEQRLVELITHNKKLELESAFSVFEDVFEQEKVKLESLIIEKNDKHELLDRNVIKLLVDEKELTARVDRINSELEVLSSKRESAESDFKNRKTQMETGLKNLQHFVEGSVDRLLRLNLISKNESDTIKGLNKEQDQVVGHSFTDDLDSNFIDTSLYIQAYLHNKGVFYQQDLLADFFALLRTNDLIVLAGDSGSGKTNLVKSFAEAIGGKAVVIPVKPNWTGSEDLLGYFNPLENRFLSTQFLETLIEADKHPETPYLICLDEMNLARVEYYFADFLSLLEDRKNQPTIRLYPDEEAAHTLVQVHTLLEQIKSVEIEFNITDVVSLADFLMHPEANEKLNKLCGFNDGESLLKYHTQLKRVLSTFINTPPTIKFPSNVRIIGAINVDETTHFLSPKILDRAHIIRFGSPLLIDWQQIDSEIKHFDLDINLPLKLKSEHFSERKPYPKFNRTDPLVEFLMQLTKDFLNPLGVEFGFRTIGQASEYASQLRIFLDDEDVIKNNFITHKILPKLVFDGAKSVNGILKIDLLRQMHKYLNEHFEELDPTFVVTNCVVELARVIRNAEANDSVVNYWL